jgi:hypothetical protein
LNKLLLFLELFLHLALYIVAIRVPRCKEFKSYIRFGLIWRKTQNKSVLYSFFLSCRGLEWALGFGLVFAWYWNPSPFSLLLCHVCLEVLSSWKMAAGTPTTIVAIW